MKNVSELIDGIGVMETSGDLSVSVESLGFNSATALRGSLFVSAEGIENEGHDSIDEAIQNGATAVVYEKEPTAKVPGIAYIKVKDSRSALGLIAQNFYNHPSKKLKLVGVTGTNGKTTTATLLFELFRSLEYHTALISTVGNRIDDVIYQTTYTTPTPIMLTAFLAKAVDAGVEYAFMECSSHGIEEERIAGLKFAGGIFTNLTQDHLDYHKTLEKYAAAKKKFFDQLPLEAFAVANCDDPRGLYMLQGTTARKYFFGINTSADFNACNPVSSLEGIKFEINDGMVESKLIGRFNVYNVLGVYAAATLLGISEDALVPALKKLDPPLGRLQFIKSDTGIYGIVDYAHTPDALENILKTLNEVKTPEAKIITVMGCGGDRDKTKRPIMGAIGSRLSDHVIFTSDNPRSEDPEQIIKDISVGVPATSHNYESVTDRAEAIKKAVGMAHSGDIVVIAGKGHEDYQIYAGTTIHFSDAEELKKCYNTCITN